MAILESISLKAKATTESMRLNTQIRANEKMMDKLTCQIGYQYVERHIDDTDSEFAEYLQEIIRLRKENMQCMYELEQLQAVRVCPQCGFENGSSGKFCVNCGGRLDDNPVWNQPGGCVCSNCGMENSDDAMFCEQCGNRLK